MTLYNPIDLWKFQDGLVDDARTAYAGGYRAPLIRSETGSGKTRMFCHMAFSASQKNKTVLIQAHRRELIQQISHTFADFGIYHAIVAPPETQRFIKVSHFKKYGKSFVDSRSKILVGSIQTIITALSRIPKPDLIITDEAHHAQENNSYGKILKNHTLAKLLFVSATPCRTDGSGLGVGHGGFVDVLLNGPSMRWLIDNGYLSDFVVYAAAIQDAKIDGFRQRYGDNAKGEIEKEYSKPAIIGSAVDYYLSHGKGLPLLVFCAGVKNAELTAKQYRDRGINVWNVDGKMDVRERDRRIAGLRDGSVQGLTSSDLIGEGLDVRGASVAQFLRPTQSLQLCRQQSGRILRADEGKEMAYIFDHVGNIGRNVNGFFVPKHGMPDDEIEWTLEGAKSKRRQSDDEPDVKIRTCPSCYCVHKAELSACPQCGHVYIATERRQIKQVEGNLVEIKRAATVKRKKEERDCKTLEDFVELGRQRGYQYPAQWAAHRMKYRKKSS